MLSESRDHLLSNKWWMAVFPGLAIVLTVLAFNIIGDWLRDFLDPRLKEKRLGLLRLTRVWWEGHRKTRS